MNARWHRLGTLNACNTPPPFPGRAQVLPVTRAAALEPRFGLTGWYMTRGDKFDAQTLLENQKMRAASSKATAADACI